VFLLQTSFSTEGKRTFSSATYGREISRGEAKLAREELCSAFFAMTISEERRETFCKSIEGF
jgi:hypothetical protein